MRHLLRMPSTPTFASVFVTVVKRTLRETSLLTASEADVVPILYMVIFIHFHYQQRLEIMIFDHRRFLFENSNESSVKFYRSSNGMKKIE